MNETKINGIASVIGTLIGIGVSVGISALFLIDPLKEYGWWGGCWQGVLFVPHWILSWFKEDVLLRAPLRTTAYNIFFWMMLIWQMFWYFHLLVNSVRSLRGR